MMDRRITGSDAGGFTGTCSEDSPYAEIQNAQNRITLTGASAAEFWRQCFQAIQAEQKIIYIHPHRDEMTKCPGD